MPSCCQGRRGTYFCGKWKNSLQFYLFVSRHLCMIGSGVVNVIHRSVDSNLRQWWWWWTNQRTIKRYYVQIYYFIYSFRCDELTRVYETVLSIDKLAKQQNGSWHTPSSARRSLGPMVAMAFCVADIFERFEHVQYSALWHLLILFCTSRWQKPKTSENKIDDKPWWHMSQIEWEELSHPLPSENDDDDNDLCQKQFNSKSKADVRLEQCEGLAGVGKQFDLMIFGQIAKWSFVQMIRSIEIPFTCGRHFRMNKCFSTQCNWWTLNMWNDNDDSAQTSTTQKSRAGNDGRGRVAVQLPHTNNIACVSIQFIEIYGETQRRAFVYCCRCCCRCALILLLFLTRTQTKSAEILYFYAIT